MSSSTTSQSPTLLDHVRQMLRLHHDSIHTGRAYLEWVMRDIRFHRMRSCEALFPPEPKIEYLLNLG